LGSLNLTKKNKLNYTFFYLLVYTVDDAKF